MELARWNWKGDSCDGHERRLIEEQTIAWGGSDVFCCGGGGGGLFVFVFLFILIFNFQVGA